MPSIKKWHNIDNKKGIHEKRLDFPVPIIFADKRKHNSYFGYNFSYPIIESNQAAMVCWDAQLACGIIMCGNKRKMKKMDTRESPIIKRNKEKDYLFIFDCFRL